MTSTYASGEVPMVGDVVERVGEVAEHDLPLGIRKGGVYTVVGVYTWGLNLSAGTAGLGWSVELFKLIRRKGAPAEWVPGPPPDDCEFAFITRKGEKPWPGVRGCGWVDPIDYHIPIATPPALPKPLPLPRRFRATSVCGAAPKGVTGCELEDGTLVWSGHGTEGKARKDKADSYLTDIEYIDK